MKKNILACLAFLLTQSTLMAADLTQLEGFVTKVNDKVYASSNYYFNSGDEVMRIENYSGQQTFKVIDNNLFIELKDQQPVKIGEIGIDLNNLKDREMTRYKIVEDIEIQTILLNKKSPKIERYLSCGITGCSIGKRVIDRTERIISLKINNGNEFCFYQNRANRINGVLYPERCVN